MNELAKHVATAVVTTIVLGLLAFLGGVFEKGVQADNAEQIRNVIRDELVTDAGKSYGEVLTEMSLGLNTVATEVNNLKDGQEELRDAVLTLAGE